ncbi:hypothetical protein BKH05_07525 [Actinomyces naeslundii]|uniref:hypothetical protein n=1 Tax=uncultured Actinomyces sp. TaxID=249061 RepID=UPI00096EDDCF|nr:hypothetical protein [uncultured Actinomyces sp.]OMG20366.1 hypothetical protein BKH05_07525 [Actinomyces naeslundii]OMG21279.1 hypothetical protein BKH37_10135 [Actinomyces naeslundii]OMG31945.1 hypothetical protein BKH34_05265 [Actinomyces naeslundii]
MPSARTGTGILHLMRDMYSPGSLRCDVGAHIAWWGRMKNMSSSVVMQVDEQRGVLWLSAP